MGIAVPTQFVSTFDLIPTRNALSTMFANINPQTGALPESGPPLSQLGSDTYHCWTLIGSCEWLVPRLLVLHLSRVTESDVTDCAVFFQIIITSILVTTNGSTPYGRIIPWPWLSSRVRLTAPAS